jgi:hypothetical protein
MPYCWQYGLLAFMGGEEQARGHDKSSAQVSGIMDIRATICIAALWIITEADRSVTTLLPDEY